MRIVSILLAISFIIPLMSAGYATSFITECSDETWRYEQADIVLEGTVLSSQPYSFQGEIYTKTIFRVDVVMAGNYSEETITVRHYGNSEVGPQIISITIDYKPGEQYRMDLLKNEDEPTTYSLVCGEMSQMKLEKVPEEWIITEEPKTVSFWQRIALFFQNFFG